MKRTFFLIIISISCFSCATVILPPVRNPGITESNLPPKTYIELVETTKASELKKAHSGGGEYRSGVPASYNTVFNFYGGRKPEWSQGRELAADLTGALLAGPYFSTDPDLVAKRNGFNVYEFIDRNPSFPKMKYFLAQGYPVIWQQHILIGYSDVDGIFIYYKASTGEFENISYQKINEFTDNGKYLYWIYNKGRVLFPKVPDSK